MRRRYKAGLMGVGLITLVVLAWLWKADGEIYYRLPIMEWPTDKPITNATAWYQGFRGYPILKHATFLPTWMRGKQKFQLRVEDGYLYVPSRYYTNSFSLVDMHISAPGYEDGMFLLFPNEIERMMKYTTNVYLTPTNQAWNW